MKVKSLSKLLLGLVLFVVGAVSVAYFILISNGTVYSNEPYPNALPGLLALCGLLLVFAGGTFIYSGVTGKTIA